MSDKKNTKTSNVGGQLGNTNSSVDNRLWANTIRRAVMQADGAKLRRIAEAMLLKAEDGDMTAIKEMGDRLDGKSVQSVEQTTEHKGKVDFGWLKE